MLMERYYTNSYKQDLEMRLRKVSYEHMLQRIKERDIERAKYLDYLSVEVEEI